MLNVKRIGINFVMIVRDFPPAKDSLIYSRIARHFENSAESKCDLCNKEFETNP